MNGFQNNKNFNLEKPIPGCLGRMVNMFELSTVARNGLLTDKPHYEGSPLARSQSDVSRTSLSGDQIEDKVVMSEFRRTCVNENPNGTPMKMLIDREMSKEISPLHNSPSLVAKLMGLDALPQQLPKAAQRSHSVGYSRSRSETPSSYWNEDRYLDEELKHELDRYPGQEEYKDIYEIWQQSRRTNCARDKSPHKGRYDDAIDNKKMALVRQKFMEAKRMATDEKLRQSKQFHDALEVLSSNKDSFLKFLEEPNSLFTQHLNNMQPIPPPPETKRITVLRPSKMLDNSRFPGKDNEPHMKKTSQVSGLDKTHVGFSPRSASWKVDENPSEPTRIVVLKPSTGNPHNIQALGYTPSTSPRISHGEEFFRELERVEAHESRKVAKTIPQLMRENLDQRDETLLSSVFSNGYIGDESSFNKSENEYAPGNVSDSEMMSPASRHSWDCVNRFGSPYSSSFSRASYSPESSVSREAKKRLSERWAMMASNGSYLEPKHVRRSSSTLGEMLALSDVKKAGRSEEECNDREASGASNAFLNNSLTKDEGINNSPRNLGRSRSVPVSSTEVVTRLNVDVPDPEGAISEVNQDATKARSSKLSLKGKVSSLFFSRNKKNSKERSTTAHSKEESLSGGISSENADDSRLKSSSPDLPTSSSQGSSRILNDRQSIIHLEAELSVKKSLASGNAGDNLDQPSPISVLEPPFEEDEHTASLSYKADRNGAEVLAYSSKSNQIDKSPPIGSIARSLSWERSFVDTASPYPSKMVSTRGAEEEEEKEEEEEWLLYIHTLLSVAGFDDGEVQFNSFMAKWHSPESPLDPSLRDKYIDLNDKQTLHEGKRRQRRSTRKLVFDCVNAAMIDIAGYGSHTCKRAIPNNEAHSSLLDSTLSVKMVDHVWARMKEWFSGETGCVSRGDSGDINSMVVERVVRKEVVERVWVEHLRLEMDNFGKEIEEKLLEDLVQEAVVELTG